jgi:hypothetical protein
MKQAILDNFLQKNIDVIFNRKIIRKGKLILYTAKDFYISLIIKTTKDINKTFDIPYPFDMYMDDDESEIFLDYRLEVLALGNEKKLDILQKAVYNSSKASNTSKYLNNILYIKTQERS